MGKFKHTAALASAAVLSSALFVALPATPAQAFVGTIEQINDRPVPPATGATNNQASLTRLKFHLSFQTSADPLQAELNPPQDQDRASTRVDLIRSDNGERTDVLTGFVPTAAEDPTVDPGPTWDIVAYFAFGSTAVNLQTGATTPNANAPANPGLYDAYVYPVNGAGQAPTSTRDSGDVCFRCFEVVQGAPVVVNNVTPPTLVSGTQGEEFVVNGDNFARDAVIEALFPGTNTVDNKIHFPLLVNPSTGVIRPNTETVRKTSIRRQFAVEASALPGPRDIRVRNTGNDLRSTGVLSNGLVISPLFVSSIFPAAASNSNPDFHTTIRGQFPLGSFGQLAGVVGNSVLVVEGSTVQPGTTAMEVAFNMTGVPGGRYRVRVVSPDRSTTSSDACSPTFDVINANNSPGTVTPVQGSTSCSAFTTAGSPSPSASTSPTATDSASPNPTGCGPGTGVGCPPSPTPSASTSVSASASPSASPSVSTSRSTTPTASSSTSRPPSTSASPTDSRTPTHLTISSSRPTIYSGEAISLTGQLFKADGTPLSGETVQVLGKVYPASSATPVASVTTDANGAWFVSNLRPPRGADYIATYNGSDAKNAARTTSNSVHVSVKTLIRVTSPRSGSAISHTTPLVVTGTTTPNKAGSTIALQMRTGTSTRKIIAIGTVRGDGTFAIHRYRDTPLPAGRYTLQVTIGPATGNSAAASQEFLLYVR
ncbi:MAG: hypothetical protein ABR520_08640 [Mycobacteriales bacterium]|nr:hypothetical protein [Frankia sp.]